MNKTAPAFEIKSARIDVLVVELKDATIEQISAGLHQRFSRISDTASVPLLIDLSRFETAESFEFNKILTLFKYYGLKIIGLRHTDKQFESLATTHKLSFHLMPKKSTKKNAQTKENETAADNVMPSTNTEPVVNDNEKNTDKTQEAPATEAIVTAGEDISAQTQAPSSSEGAEPTKKPDDKAPAMIVSRPVRTGQQIYAKNADLIVLDLVSPGAEVLADGNIHVYAPLRGRALAGVSGNRKARIFTHCMQAELVSIAGVYRTIDQSLPQDIANKPAQIYIEQDKLVIKALK